MSFRTGLTLVALLALGCSIEADPSRPVSGGARPVTGPSAGPVTGPSAGSPTQSPASTIEPSPPPEDADRRGRRVFATYLPWFETAPGWDHWRWAERDPEKVDAAGRRTIAAARYPAIGPYDSRDEAVLGYHLLLMRAAGLDGAFVNWYGRGNRLDQATLALFDKVAAWRRAYGLRFSLALMVDAGPYLALDGSAQVAELGADFRYAQDTFCGRPEYQRLEGKPVLLFFPKPDPADTTRQAVSPEEMSAARERVASPFWLGIEHPDPTFKAAADLPFGWIAGAAESGRDYGAAYLEWFYPAIGYQRDKGGWALPLGIGIAYPGFDDGGVHGWTQDPGRRRWIARDIGGRATLDLTWDHYDRFVAQDSGAPVPWMQIATFNDWNEGSEIEPSQELGTGPLELVARRVAGFKASSAPSGAARRFPAMYLERRRSGTSEESLAEALKLFLSGSYDAALDLAGGR